MEKRKSSISAILLAGGKGSRLKSAMPKQFLSLGGKPIVQYSYELFLSMPEIAEIIIVCEPQYKTLFEKETPKFAFPGKRRQDSVINGFKQVSTTCTHILVHDTARPFLRKENVEALIKEGLPIGAATLGVPLPFTIKKVDGAKQVTETLDRDQLYNIQTPQLLHRDVLLRGIKHADEQNLTVTDDVAFAELIDHPVKIVHGSNDNLKITTPFDLQIAKQLIHETV